MLTESRLVYLIINVKDVAASRDFYENALGFSALEANGGSVKYDAGHVTLWLNGNAARGRAAASTRNYSSNITFLVPDLEGMRSALESRGVKFSRTIKYNAGLRADFYDPDGRWFSLYEPSEEAMGWPSGEKIRAFLGAADGDAESPARDLRPTPDRGASDFRLDGKNVIYFFLFVSDWEETFKFYHDTLGLRNIEGGPCKRGSTSAVDGVIKYDVGGTILTTHHVDDHARAGLELKREDMKGIVPVFRVEDVRRAAQELSGKGVGLSPGDVSGLDGGLAEVEDPAGHALYLCEPGSGFSV